jgi:hypothetical protein
LRRRLATIPKALAGMRGHVASHGYLPLLLAVLAAAVPGLAVAWLLRREAVVAVWVSLLKEVRRVARSYSCSSRPHCRNGGGACGCAWYQVRGLAGAGGADGYVLRSGRVTSPSPSASAPHHRAGPGASGGGGSRGASPSPPRSREKKAPRTEKKARFGASDSEGEGLAPKPAAARRKSTSSATASDWPRLASSA